MYLTHQEHWILPSTFSKNITCLNFPHRVVSSLFSHTIIFFLRYIAFSPSDHYEACYISIIWNRSILQLAVQSLTRAFCSWPSCKGSVIWGVLREKWCHLLLFARCLHSGCSLWWLFFFLWRSCWSPLQNSTSLPFWQDSRLVVSGCVPAASISSLSWWSTVALFRWSYTVHSLLDILCVHWIPITFLSCLLWELFSFLWSSVDTPQVPQLYSSTLFTSVSYSRILVVSFVFQFFFQIV